MTHYIVHDLNKETSYTVASPEECKDAVDKSAVEAAIAVDDCIAMGLTVVEIVGHRESNPR